MYKVYTTTNCPNCRELKNILNKSHIQFEELNIETDFKAMAKLVENNLMQVPVLEINGQLKSGEISDIIQNIEVGV